MSDFFPAFVGLVQNAALLLAAVLVIDLAATRASARHGILQKILIGAVLGVVGVVVMLTHWTFMPGIVFDTRSILIAITGLFLGGIPAAMVMGCTAVFRLIQGGVGAWTGVGVILASGLIGIAWSRRKQYRLEKMSWRELYLFGIVVHVAMLALLLTLPRDVAHTVIPAMAGPVLLIYPLATAMLGTLMVRRLDREQMEAAVRENAERNRLLAEVGLEGILIHKNAVAIDLNPSLSRIFGFDREELLRRNFMELVHPDDHDLVRENIVKDYAPPYVIRMFKRTGEPFFAEIESRNFPRERATWRVSAVRDVTERRRAEVAMEQSEKAFKALAEQCPISIMRFDEQGRVSFVNEWHLRVFGGDKLDAGFFVGKAVHELRGLVTSGVSDRVERLFHGESLTVDELFIPETSGGWSGWVRLRGVPLFEDEKVRGAILIREDISRLKAAQEEVVGKNQELQRFLADKDMFFSIIAHDLRAPFSGFQGACALLSENFAGMPEADRIQLVKNMKRSAENLYHLLEDLLEWARMQRGLMEFAPMACPLSEVVPRNLELFQPRAREKDIDLRDETLGEVVVHADRSILNTILRNLLSNALKFSNQGGSVVVRAEVHGPMAHILVHDDGIGMEQSAVDALFALDQKTQYRKSHLFLTSLRRLLATMCLVLRSFPASSPKSVPSLNWLAEVTFAVLPKNIPPGHGRRSRLRPGADSVQGLCPKARWPDLGGKRP